LPAFGSTEYWVLRAKDKISDPAFVYYLAKSDLLRKSAEKSMVGASGRQRAQIESIQNVDVGDTTLENQQKIAKILSTYDDLIENNSKRIENLESIVNLLYNRYFEIPEATDWEEKPIKEFGRVVTGKTPRKAEPKNYTESGTMFIKTPDMHNDLFVLDTAEKLSVLGVASQKNKTLPAGSICISCIGTVGVVGIMTKPSQTNQQINTIVLNDDVYQEYLVMKLKASREILENLGSNGATMTNVNKTKLEELLVTKPPRYVVLDFHNSVKPMYDLILILQQKTMNLAKVRDILLPRLMSREIEV
jgi:type I restriction enzyme S subunit